MRVIMVIIMATMVAIIPIIPTIMATIVAIIQDPTEDTILVLLDLVGEVIIIDHIIRVIVVGM